MASAFIKSIRGSDVDAALHYLARMFEAGEDPRFVARRMVISASEDIGEADPTALPLAVAAAQAVQLIGMPEARIVLAQAVVHLALAPKSNASYLAIGAAAGRRPRRPRRPGARCTCATPTTRGQPGTATGRATGTRTTTRAAWSSSSTPPTPWSSAPTTPPATAGFERELAGGWPACARCCAAAEAGGDRVAPAVGQRLRREVPPMSIGELAGLIAALAFVLLVGFLGYPLYKLGKVFDETAVSVHDVTDEHAARCSRRSTDDGHPRPTAQLVRGRHDHRNVAETTENVAALTRLFAATLGSPVVKVAAFSYGVRQALSRVAGRRRGPQGLTACAGSSGWRSARPSAIVVVRRVSRPRRPTPPRASAAP